MMFWQKERQRMIEGKRKKKQEKTFKKLIPKECQLVCAKGMTDILFYFIFYFYFLILYLCVYFFLLYWIFLLNPFNLTHPTMYVKN